MENRIMIGEEIGRRIKEDKAKNIFKRKGCADLTMKNGDYVSIIYPNSIFKQDAYTVIDDDNNIIKFNTLIEVAIWIESNYEYDMNI